MSTLLGILWVTLAYGPFLIVCYLLFTALCQMFPSPPPPTPDPNRPNLARDIRERQAQRRIVESLSKLKRNPREVSPGVLLSYHADR